MDLGYTISGVELDAGAEFLYGMELNLLPDWAVANRTVPVERQYTGSKLWSAVDEDDGSC